MWKSIIGNVVMKPPSQVVILFELTRSGSNNVILDTGKKRPLQVAINPFATRVFFHVISSIFVWFQQSSYQMSSAQNPGKSESLFCGFLSFLTEHEIINRVERVKCLSDR